MKFRFAESITRSNCGMVFGNLEMEYADGEVRIETGLISHLVLSLQVSFV